MNNVIFIGKSLTVMTDQDLFINYISQHYDELKAKYKAFCGLNNYSWDEDIFSDTIVKCYDAIAKKGHLNDTTAQGIENFFFKSFSINTKREQMYARVAKRDFNVTSDNINTIYEEWFNTHKISSEKKVYNDLWTDFSTLYIMTLVEDQFPAEDFYLFRLKTLCNMTYKELQEQTNEKRIRQRIVTIKNWLKENIKKEDVKEIFHQFYGNLNPE